MYGNVVTNRQLRSLKSSGCIDIRPFDDRQLKEAAYTLNPGKVLRLDADGSLQVIHTFSEKRPEFLIDPNDYVVIEAKQTVTISVSGIVGTFVTASSNIENGLLVVAGQIDSKYGVTGEALRFGVKNLLSVQNTLFITTRLVHLQLIDMRGSASDPVKKSALEDGVWAGRRSMTRWADDPNLPNYNAISPDD